VLESFRELTPLVETLSLDEASSSGGRTAAHAADTDRLGFLLLIRRPGVTADHRIYCSVGCASTKSSRQDGVGMGPKPDGAAGGTEGKTLDHFCGRCRVGAWGIGARTTEQLARFGFLTDGRAGGRQPAAAVRRIIGRRRRRSICPRWAQTARDTRGRRADSGDQ